MTKYFIFLPRFPRKSSKRALLLRSAVCRAQQRIEKFWKNRVRCEQKKKNIDDFNHTITTLYSTRCFKQYHIIVMLYYLYSFYTLSSRCILISYFVSILLLFTYYTIIIYYIVMFSCTIYIYICM